MGIMIIIRFHLSLLYECVLRERKFVLLLSNHIFSNDANKGLFFSFSSRRKWEYVKETDDDDDDEDISLCIS